MNNVYTNFTPTPHQMVKEREDEVFNNAGGAVFKITDLQRLRRFLILGSDAPTFYQSAGELTKESGELIIKMVSESPAMHRVVVKEIRDVYESGHAPKQDPTLFALAIACSYGEAKGRSFALDTILLLRTATHLFTFLTYVQMFRGWGSGLRKRVAQWYNSFADNHDALAYQMVKYRNRSGWTHRDVLRKAHPSPATDQLGNLYTFANVGETWDDIECPQIIETFQAVKNASAEEVVKVLRGGARVPWETLPTEALRSPEVWKELVFRDNVPLMALIRKISTFKKVGLFEDKEFILELTRRLTRKGAIRSTRIHPMHFLNARSAILTTQSKGFHGSILWDPNPSEAVSKVADALDEGFEIALGNVSPTGKRVLIGLDVSGSMTTAVSGSSVLSCRDAATALAYVQSKVDPDTTMTYMFSSGTIGSRVERRDYRALTEATGWDSLASAIADVERQYFGSTDCALPMQYAMKNNLKVDTFIVYTDNETWSGYTHPYKALQEYRKHSGINDAKLIVVAMTNTNFSIADPTDANMLDVVGFDTSTPELINSFIKGEF